MGGRCGFCCDVFQAEIEFGVVVVEQFLLFTLLLLKLLVSFQIGIAHSIVPSCVTDAIILDTIYSCPATSIPTAIPPKISVD